MDDPVVNVLLIEDNPVEVQLIREYLGEAEAMPFKLDVAPRLSVGLERLATERIDVLVLDLSLPDGSGINALVRIKKHSPDVPALVLINSDVAEKGNQALREGAADYICKGQLGRDGHLLICAIRYAIEREEREKVLRESEQRYRQLLSAVTSYSYSVKVKDGVAVSTDHSQGCESVTGFTPEDHTADPYLWFRMIHPDDRAMVQRHVSNVLTREVTPPIEHRILHRDGTTHWVRDTIVPHNNDAGELVHYDGLVEDISARKEAEMKTRYQRDFAENLVETVQAIVLLVDTRGTILRFNSYGEELLGYVGCDMIGEDVATALVPESERPAIRAHIENVHQGHHTIVSTHPIIAKNGVMHEIQWKGKALRDEQDNVLYVLLTGHDVTDLKRAQQQALESERLAGIGQMITGLAHESRNVLQRSQSCLDLLARVVKDRPKALDYIGRIQTAQDDLGRIHGEVRDFASPIILERRVFQLVDLIRESWANLSSARDGREAHLRVHSPAIALDCEVDRFRIEQVFRNILENAISVCDEAVEIDAELREVKLNRRPAVRVAFRDNGPGFTAEQAERIFEPFYTTKTHGTGLGMAIAKRIVQAHGGRIEVGVGLGPGAEIIVTLLRKAEK